MGGEFFVICLLAASLPLLGLLAYLSARRGTRRYAVPVLLASAIAGVAGMALDHTFTVAEFLGYFALGAIVAGVIAMFVAFGVAVVRWMRHHAA